VPSEYKAKEREDKVKQAVDWLSKNAMDPGTGKPHTPGRIQDAIKTAGINLDNRPIEEQMSNILAKIKVIIPIRIETKKLRVRIPAVHTGKAYGIIKEYMEKEDWLSNGDLQVTINIPAGMQMAFFDKLNAITHGSAIVEEIKNK
jgi:ribosome maturation protein Sdo1